MGLRWAGFVSWVAGEGLFKLKLKGPGLIFFGTDGGLTQKKINGKFVVDSGQWPTTLGFKGEYIVDTRHIAALKSLNFSITKVGPSWLGAFLGGEGLVGRMLARESLFMNEFTAVGKPGELFISPGIPGDVQHYHLSGNGLMVKSAGFVASGPEVTIDSKFQGFKGFSSGESLFLLRATGYEEL